MASFGEFSSAFLHQFASSRKHQKTSLTNFRVKQSEGEPLRDYVKNFTAAALEVPSMNQEILTSALTRGLKERDFFRSLAKRPARDFDDVLCRAEKYVYFEEAQKCKKEELRDKMKERVEVHRDVAPKQFREHEGRTGLVPRLGEPRSYTPIMASRSRVLMAIAGNKDLKWPANYSTVLSRPKSKMPALEDEIEKIVKKGWLAGWVKMDHGQANNAGANRNHHLPAKGGGRGNAGADKEDHPPRGTINMIVGGPTDGDSNRAWKAHGRGEIRPIMEVGAVRKPIVSFRAEDQRGVSPFHNDALVITATIANFEVARIMVDTGSSINVLFYEAYLRMGVEMEEARKCYVEVVRKGAQKKSKRKEVESERETNPLKMTKRKEKEEPDMMSVKPQEVLMSVELVIGDPTKVTRIGMQLGSEVAATITSFLRENLDVFA
ncbi:hypothetical protein DH2020_003964 [Rehmannia glutinosa]|uniref:Retrotransposon gag domain-containing protein n=1 Tax=Rehmannia glutinosa TaxID=99300 RepID=A0ABR0XN82_REHGL